jgi:hypothetical protein
MATNLVAHGPGALPLRVRARARESAKKVVTNQINVHTPHLHRVIAVAFYCSLEIMEISTPYDLAIAANVSPAARRLTASARW